MDPSYCPESPTWADSGEFLTVAAVLSHSLSHTLSQPLSRGSAHIGACALLPLEQRGVVDSELRVHIVQGLRVVDASVMPLITTANP